MAEITPLFHLHQKIKNRPSLKLQMPTDLTWDLGLSLLLGISKMISPIGDLDLSFSMLFVYSIRAI